MSVRRARSARRTPILGIFRDFCFFGELFLECNTVSDVCSVLFCSRPNGTPPRCTEKMGGVTPQFSSCFSIFHVLCILFGKLHKGTPHYTRRGNLTADNQDQVTVFVT